MITRVEVNEDGDFYIIIPNDIAEDYGLDAGDRLEWDATDDEFLILSIA